MKKWLIVWTSLAAPLMAATPSLDPMESAFVTLVPKDTPPSTCLRISRGPKSGFETTLPAVDALIKKIESAIQRENLTELQADFHPRLKTTFLQLSDAMVAIKRALGAPNDVAVFRSWLLTSADGTPAELPCDEGEFVVTTHYGYSAQIGVWLQVMGKGELGRIFVSIVPHGDRAYIGAWHLHQWTHLSMDSLAWQERALAFAKAEEKPSAYLLQDIAFKLLNQKKFVLPQALTPVKLKLDGLMTLDQWTAEVLRALNLSKNASDTAYSAPTIRTSLAQDGAGINLYLKTPKEIVPKQLRSDCRILAARIFTNAAFRGVDGIKCMFVMEGEAIYQEGRLGGQYYTRSEAVPPLGKEEAKSSTK